MKPYELVRAARSYADAIDKDRGMETGLTDLLRDAADELERLMAWKAEATEVLSDLDLQGIGRLLRFPLGTNISKAIKPSIERLLKEAVTVGSACHSVEQHMPETTTKGEQAD